MKAWPCAALSVLLFSAHVARAAPDGCLAPASKACRFTFAPQPGGMTFGYYSSASPGGSSAAPTHALIAIHGHPRDANKTFDAARRAVQTDTLVIAPIFQVGAARAAKCSTPGVPEASATDAVWTCSSWLQGAPSENAEGLTSFAALDALVAEITRQWPGLRTITIAGFSAGAQMVQHYIGFAATPQAGQPSMRYVVADPGTWLYFDSLRPQPPTLPCPGVNRWKYGTEGLPASLGRSAAEARAAYAAADIHYVEAALDDNAGRGTAYRVLDKSCGAMAQGPYRLQRGMAYADYDRTLLAPVKHREVTVVPGCAHDVACVFPSIQSLLGP